MQLVSYVFSEIPVKFDRAPQCHIYQHSAARNHHYENLKFKSGVLPLAASLQGSPCHSSDS
jgi:hypothetical protein